jgi:hypothetical protein
VNSLLEIKRAVVALQKEVAELKARMDAPKPEPKEKPNGEKRAYQRKSKSGDVCLSGAPDS